MDSSRTLPADVGHELLDELVGSKRLIETLAHLIADGLLHVDDQHRIVRFNPAAERILGYSSVHIVGADLNELLHESNTTDPLVMTADLEAQELRLVLRDTQGEAVRVHARSTALMREGIPEGWIVIFNETRRVDEIEQLKNELVSTVSHELKTPLSAIKAYTATLRHNPTLYEKRRDEFLAVVEQQADRLARIVEDMLLVTRVETDQLLRRRVRMQLATLVEVAVSEVGADPVQHPIERQVEGVEVSGDPDRLRDVLRNLIENAVKYSPGGGPITVSAQETGGYTHVEIADRGIGIAEEHLPYIYDRFYRVESDTASPTGGSGLGLYIVNALVRAHGGTIDVRSTPGEGTAFTLRLPLR